MFEIRHQFRSLVGCVEFTVVISERKSAISRAHFRVPNVSRVFRKCCARFPTSSDPRRINTLCNVCLLHPSENELQKQICNQTERGESAKSSRKTGRVSTCSSTSTRAHQYNATTKFNRTCRRRRRRRPFGHPGLGPLSVIFGCAPDNLGLGVTVVVLLQQVLAAPWLRF